VAWLGGVAFAIINGGNNRNIASGAFSFAGHPIVFPNFFPQFV
jgi:hypothetical protein